MKHLFKKAVVVITTVLMVLTLPQTVAAEEAVAHWQFVEDTYGTYDSITGSWKNMTITEKNGDRHYHRLKLYAINAYPNVNDVAHASFCTQPGIQLDLKTQTGYISKDISEVKTDDGRDESSPVSATDAQIAMCELYSYFGYGFNAARTNELYRVATQHLIWRAFGFKLSYMNDALKNAVAAIEADYNSYMAYKTNGISFNNTSKKISGVGKQNKVTFTDTKGSQYLKLMTFDPLPKGLYAEVSADGTKVDVWADSSYAGKGTETITMHAVNGNAANQAGTSVCWYHSETQNMAKFADAPDSTIRFTVTLERNITFALEKKSKDTNITEGNGSYSLEGAVYGVYSDSACKNEIARITTGKDGKGSAVSALFVTYNKVYYRELSAPRGYCRDEKIYEVGIASDQKASLTVEEVPGNDPLVIEIRKEAEDVEGMIPSLSGAVFEVAYYDTTDRKLAVWYIETKEIAGKYAAVLDDAHLAEGYTSDPFIRTKEGTIVVPVGYLLVKEVRAPAGYSLRGASYIAEKGGVAADVNDGVVRFDVAKDDAGGFKMVAGNVFTERESSVRGGIRFRKNTAEDADDEEDLTTEISIVNQNEYTVLLHSEDHTSLIATAAPHEKFMTKEGTVYTFVTDRKGEWESWPDYLPAGTYEFYEEKAPHDYTSQKTSFTSVTIDEEEKIYDLTEDLIDKKVFVSKKDAGGEEVEGASMTVTDQDGNIVDQWTSGKDEHPITGLFVGETYTIHEECAPNGFAVASDITFTVSDDMTVNQSITVIDKRVEVKKSDGLGNEVEGAHIQVIDKDGEIIDEWDSAEEAHIISNLVVNEEYTLKETQAPDGYYYEAESTFIVSDDGMDQMIEMIDEPIRYTIVKTDNVYGNHVKGAKLRLTDITDPEKTKEVILNHEGITEDHPETYEKLLIAEHTYLLEEIETPWGFETSAPIQFTVAKECPSEEPITITMTDERKVYYVSVVKVDAQDRKKKLKNAEFTIFTDDDEIALDAYGNECIGETDEEGAVIFTVNFNEDISGYYVKETAAPQGYRLNKEKHPVVLSETYDFAKDEPLEIIVNDEALPATGIGISAGVIILFLISAGYVFFCGIRKTCSRK